MNPWRLQLHNASHIVPETVTWCWEGRIPLGVLSLLVGPAGRGKSTLAYDLAARVSRGQLGRNPANVMIATSEDSLAHTAVPRLMAAGADLERVDFVSMRDSEGERGLTLPDDIGDLEDAITAHGAQLVVLDPVVSHISGEIDSHKDHSVRRALDPISKLAESTGAAVLGIGHLNKSASGDVLHRLIGSVGFGAAARSVLLFAEKPEEPDDTTERVLLHGKCNLAPLAPALRFQVEARSIDYEGEEIGTSGLAWKGEDPSITAAAVLSPKRDDDLTERDLARHIILDALSEGEQRWKDIGDLLNDEDISEKAAGKRARDALKGEGLIDVHKVGSNWYWYLSSNLSTPPAQVGGAQVEKPAAPRGNAADNGQVEQSSDTGQVPPIEAAIDNLTDAFDIETERIAP